MHHDGGMQIIFLWWKNMEGFILKGMRILTVILGLFLAPVAWAGDVIELGHQLNAKKNAEYAAIESHGYTVIAGDTWQIAGENVPPACLVAEWTSGDNYEAYEKAFPAASDFYRFPGKYWGVEVPLAPVNAWGKEIALAQKYPTCKNLQVKKNKHPEEQNTYRMLLNWEASVCEKLLPAFKGQCHSLVYVHSNEHTTYT